MLGHADTLHCFPLRLKKRNISRTPTLPPKKQLLNTVTATPRAHLLNREHEERLEELAEVELAVGFVLAPGENDAVERRS